MSTKKNPKKKVYIFLGVLLFILATNFVVSSIIKQKITEFLLHNESEYYTATVDNVHFKLLRRSVILSDVFIIPNKKSIDSLKAQKSSKKELENITLSSLKLNGIGLIDIVFNKKININTIEINDLLIHSFENSKIHKKKKEKKPFNIDSIYLSKLNGLAIDNIIFNNFQYEVYDFAKSETTFKSQALSFKSSGIILEDLGNHYFKLNPAKEKFEINNIQLNFEDAQYDFAVDQISLNFKEHFVTIKNIKFKPQIDRAKLANTYNNNDPVYDASLKELKVFNLQLPKLIKGEGLFIDSIQVSNLDLKIYKDNRKPFNENKRPGLPHTGLKRMKFPMHIQKTTVNNSDILIETRMEKSDALMSIPISNLNANITNITSIKSYRENPMKVTADGLLMKTGVAHLDAVFPLIEHQNTFYFSGSLGEAKMKIFDSALYPVLGLKVLKGNLDKLTFNASANEKEATGKMTMLYHNLEAEVFKSKSTHEENKFLSWTVNSLVKKSNPKKNKTPREVTLQAERVIYKGLGNYFWKTLQSGIINTVAGRNQTEASKKRKHHNKKK
ncbi:MAG: hypothetical protein PSN34_08345 [Urechidicola sp.]|nr:hypothetical protein [Urechidicola sp.]